MSENHAKLHSSVDKVEEVVSFDKESSIASANDAIHKNLPLEIHPIGSRSRRSSPSYGPKDPAQVRCTRAAATVSDRLGDPQSQLQTLVVSSLDTSVDFPRRPVDIPIPPPYGSKQPTSVYTQQSLQQQVDDALASGLPSQNDGLMIAVQMNLRAIEAHHPREHLSYVDEEDCAVERQDLSSASIPLPSVKRHHHHNTEQQQQQQQLLRWTYETDNANLTRAEILVKSIWEPKRLEKL